MSSKFWLENLGSLFSSIQLVPTNSMNLEDQLNSITRIIIILSLILWLFNFPYFLHFLIISLLFIIIIYYIQRNTMKTCKENFSQPVQQNSNNIVYKTILNTGQPLPFCNDEVSIDPPSNFAVSLNQSLAGNALPVTKIKPVIVPPAYDLESWRDNNLITYSVINSPGIQQDMYLSGYAESTCCDYISEGTELVPEIGRKEKTQIGGQKLYQDYSTYSVENYGEIVSPVPVDMKPYIPTVRENYGEIVSPVPVDMKPYIPTVRENYNLETIPNAEIIRVQKNSSGWVNTTCGYNPEQVKLNLPSNLAVGNCVQDPKMSQYNKNLFTQTVSPGVYSINQVNEPINSNIGISFNQQFEPVSCRRDEKGLEYTLHDPRIIEPVLEAPMLEDKPNYDNVYDPRFYGYGTSYRSYFEPVTGQTRFMYDDVNAIRMPNYITRNKIDHLPYGDTYGSMKEGSEYGNEYNSKIRYLAQDSWLRDSLQFRDDLQQRLMRKVNAEAWQKRMFPNSSRPVGSNKRINN